LVFLIVGASIVFARDSRAITDLAPQISKERLLESVRTLSTFEGRQSGTPGGDAAAAYIAERLPAAVCQTFPIDPVLTSTVQAEVESGGRMRTLVNGIDFLPVLSGAGTVKISAPVVFVGYGIIDPENGMNEYANVSVTGAIVLFLRGQPKGYQGRFGHIEKEKAAKARGAVGYLTVTGPILNAYEQRRGMTSHPMGFYTRGDDAALPGLWITPAVGDLLLKPVSLSLELFQLESRNRSSETGSTVTLTMHQRRWTSTAANVIGFLPGSDPQLQQETLVLGAHYDHFGKQGGILFPGADDNASGTAVLLEVARLLTGKFRTKRSIIFIAFAGEEQGLLGSKAYISQPFRPLHLTTSMINVDHVAAGNGKIAIGLSGIEKSIAQAAGDGIGLRDRLELFGFFPGGDHVPFKEAGVATATIFSSGAHPDFHRPSDTPDRIRPEILVSAANYTLAVLLLLANRDP
jgi:hypothetical protein